MLRYLVEPLTFLFVFSAAALLLFLDQKYTRDIQKQNAQEANVSPLCIV